MSIRLKITIIFLAIALIPLLFVSALTFHNYKESLEASRLVQLKDLATFKTEKIETYFSELKSHMSIAQGFYNIRVNFPILKKSAHAPSSPEFIAAKKMLDEQLPQMQSVLGLSDIMLLSPEGSIIYTSNSKHFPIDFGNPLPDPQQKAFEEGKRRIYISDIFYSNVENNRSGFLIVGPFTDSKGALVGVMAFEADAAPIYKLIQDTTGLGETGETQVGKKTGNQAVYLNPSRHDPETVHRKPINIGDNIGLPMQEAVQGRNGSGQSIDYRGKKVIAAWKYIPSMDWGMVVKIDTAEAFADVSNLRKLAIIILIIVSSLAGVMAFSIAQSISGPIKDLIKGVGIIGSGNLEYKVGTDLKDEIGQLSRAFDKMTHALSATTASRDELNREIAERRHVEEKLRESESRVRMKLESVLSPEGNIENLELSDIIDIRSLQMIMEDFYKLSHIPMAIIDIKGKVLIGVGWQDICTKFHRIHPESCKHCIESDTQLTSDVRKGEFKLYKCKNNMWDVSTPLMIGGKKLGNLFMGQFFFVDEKPDYELFRKQARLYGFNESDYMAALDAAPRLSRETIDRGMAFFLKLSGMLSKLSYSNVKLARLLTERDILTNSLRESEGHLKRSNESLEQFAYVASHDLQEPLRMMASYSELLERRYKGKMDSDADDFINFIVDGAKRMQKLINDLLAYSRVGRSEKAASELDCNAILDRILASMKHTIDENGAVVTHDNLPTLIGIETDFIQLFQNLLGNAIKFHGEEPLRIHIGVEKKTKEWMFSVRDNGIGIDLKYKDKIFLIFQRLHGRDKYPGTGIGLSICKKIVERQGGRIWIESEPGKGSVFYFTIPARN